MPVVQLDIDSSGAIKGLGKYDSAVTKSSTNTSTSFNSMESAAKKLAAVFVSYQLGKFFLDFGQAAISAASDMQETQGKFDVVFRNLGSYAEDAAQRISSSYGMSKRESKLYLSSLQDLLVPTGLARDKAAEMSVAFTELAADLGSFNNVPTATVVRDIQSALAGGSETMTKYGIDVKVGAVNAEILALGLDTSTKAAERQSRTVALLSIAQRDSSDAMGDFARTQDSFANQSKILQATLENLRVEVGEGLLPIITEAVIELNAWYQANEKLISMNIEEWVNRSVEILQSLATAVDWVADRFIAFGNHLALMEAVGQGRVSFFEAMTMSAQETATWLDANSIAAQQLQWNLENLTTGVLNDSRALDENKESLFAAEDAASGLSVATNDLVENTKKHEEAVITNTDSVINQLVPAEEKLAQQIDKVTQAANISTVAINQQASAASQAASIIGGGVSGTDVSSAELAKWDGSYKVSGGASGGAIIAGGQTTFAGADPNLRTGEGLGGGFSGGLGGGFQGGLNGGATTNIYVNQSVSRSDVTAISEEQQRVDKR